MNLLLDANFSWRLIEKLSAHFPNIRHVNSLSLPTPLTDEEVWTFAKNHGLTIVTNDDDFHHMLMSREHPPKVILLRLGNQSTETTLSLLIKHKNNLMSLDSSSDLGILEIY
jgi:predicted nuclease of predicted toxin-antitoxin system